MQFRSGNNPRFLLLLISVPFSHEQVLIAIMIGELDYTTGPGRVKLKQKHSVQSQLKSDVSGASMIGLSKYLDRDTASNVCLLVITCESMGDPVAGAGVKSGYAGGRYRKDKYMNGTINYNGQSPIFV